MKPPGPIELSLLCYVNRISSVVGHERPPSRAIVGRYSYKTVQTTYCSLIGVVVVKNIRE